MNLRKRLKEETRSAHDRVETIVDARRSFASIDAYSSYLRASYGPRAGLESMCRAALGADAARRWEAFLVQGAMLRDLEHLGIEPPNVAPPPDLLADRAAATGALYVLAGSALGGATLASHAQALGLTADLGAGHLFAQRAVARGFAAFAVSLDTLEFDSAQIRRCIAGALAAFETMALGFAEPTGDLACNV